MFVSLLSLSFAKYLLRFISIISPHAWEGLWTVWCVLSHVWLSVTPWTVAHQVPLSLEFSRQLFLPENHFSDADSDSFVVLILDSDAGKYWRQVVFLTRKNLPDQGIKLDLISWIGRQILHHYTPWELHSTVKQKFLYFPKENKHQFFH